MGRDLTTSSASHQDSEKTQLQRASWRLDAATLPSAARLLAAMALGALLLALAYQIPVTHTIDIGGYDSAYVQGFFEPERDAGPKRPELAGSDGSARWTRASSYLLFPQAGLPAQLTLRLRGWRPNGAAPNVQVLLNGTTLLDQFRAGADWEDHTFQINGGLLKPNDVVIEIRSETAHIGANDPREVGVLIDRATFHSGPAPIIPYPPQLLYGALAAGMLWLLTRRDERRTTNDERYRAIWRSSFVTLADWQRAFSNWLPTALPRTAALSVPAAAITAGDRWRAGGAAGDPLRPRAGAARADAIGYVGNRRDWRVDGSDTGGRAAACRAIAAQRRGRFPRVRAAFGAPARAIPSRDE